MIKQQMAALLGTERPNNGPEKRCPVPNDDDPAITTSGFLQLLHIPTIKTSFWHQAFDISLSHRPIMNVTNTISVPALNTLRTSSYLHPAGGMTAQIDATLPGLLLHQHVNNYPAIITTIHDPSHLLPFYGIGSAITTVLNTPSLLLLYVCNNLAIMTSLLLPFCQNNPEIMMATHTNLLLLYICNDPAIMTATHTSLLFLLLYVRDNPAIMTAMHACLLLPYVCDDPAIMTTTQAKLILTLQLIAVFTQVVVTAQDNF
jgi:hypothetical protein